MRVFRAASLRSVTTRRGMVSLSRPRLLVATAEEEKIEDSEVEELTRMLTTDRSRNEAEYGAFRERVLVAEGHLSDGDYGKAVAEYEAVARAFPPNYYFGELYLGLGCAFVGLEQHAHAVTVFDRALKQDPHNINVYLNKGLALVVLGQMEPALETFKKGLVPARRGNETEYLVQILLYCGQIYEELDNDEAALKMYHDALEEEVDYSQLWYLAGCIYAKQGDKVQAMKHFREAIDCTNPWPSAFYKLSLVVADPLEKKRLYDMFVTAQREMARREGDAPAALLK